MKRSNVRHLNVLGSALTFNVLVCLDDVLDNDKLKVDFKPLYQCIHIYTALDSLEELQRSYQADRKVCDQFVGSVMVFNPPSGTVNPHTSESLVVIIAAHACPRNRRVLHRRVARPPDNSRISQRARS